MGRVAFLYTCLVDFTNIFKKNVNLKHKLKGLNMYSVIVLPIIMSLPKGLDHAYQSPVVTTQCRGDKEVPRGVLVFIHKLFIFILV